MEEPNDKKKGDRIMLECVVVAFVIVVLVKVLVKLAKEQIK